VDAPIAIYKCEVPPWKWAYELFRDRLIVTGRNGTDRQFAQMELRHSNDIPDESVTPVEVWHPAFRWILAGGIGAGVIVFALGIAAMVALDVPIGYPWGIAWAAIVYGAFGWPLKALLKKRYQQRFATFKSAADGHPLLTLSSAPDPADDSFEQFVDEVVSAIRNYREPDPHPSQAIKS
jgi:hypothetical protein